MSQQRPNGPVLSVGIVLLAGAAVVVGVWIHALSVQLLASRGNVTQANLRVAEATLKVQRLSKKVSDQAAELAKQQADLASPARAAAVKLAEGRQFQAALAEKDRKIVAMSAEVARWKSQAKDAIARANAAQSPSSVGSGGDDSAGSDYNSGYAAGKDTGELGHEVPHQIMQDDVNGSDYARGFMDGWRDAMEAKIHNNE